MEVKTGAKTGLFSASVADLLAGPRPDSISAQEALDWLQSPQASGSSFIDVRSEGEFNQGNLPHFRNIPVLNDLERHEVGLAYKTHGQAHAIELGEGLVQPVRGARVQAWLDQLAQARNLERPGVVICWRGGMRSRIAAHWIAQAGGKVVTVQGGYKALRNQLIEAWNDIPQLIVLSGLTGCRKTELIQELKSSKIDLEGLACHRGSSFGRYMSRPQPSQATFENCLALELRGRKTPTLVEDESSRIGSVGLPENFKLRMKTSPIVILEAPMEIRVEAIRREYVERPLEEGHSAQELEDSLLAALARIREKLGGLRHMEIQAQIQGAFRPGQAQSSHDGWIEALLQNYYDPMYNHAFARQSRPIAFKGNYEECREWIHANIKPN